MSVVRILVKAAVVVGLVAAPLLVARAWKQSRTQVHTITHGRG